MLDGVVYFATVLIIEWYIMWNLFMLDLQLFYLWLRYVSAKDVRKGKVGAGCPDDFGDIMFSDDDLKFEKSWDNCPFRPQG